VGIRHPREKSAGEPQHGYESPAMTERLHFSAKQSSDRLIKLSDLYGAEGGNGNAARVLAVAESDARLF